jgi:hypothetical protein
MSTRLFDRMNVLSLALMTGLMSSVVQAQSQFAWQLEQTINTQGLPEAGDIGDVNGDGLLDVVAINNSFSDLPLRNHVLVYLQQEDGSLAEPLVHEYTQRDGSARGLTLSNLDDDDAMEIATGYFGGLTLFDVQDGALFSQSVSSSRGNGVLESLDINDDQIMDLVGLHTNRLVTFYTGDGALGVDTQFELATPNAMGTRNTLKVADINRDGLDDLAVLNGGSSFGSNLAIYPQDGLGGFQLPLDFDLGGFETTSSLALGDFNNDERIDVVLTRFSSQDNHFWLYEQHSSGQFLAPLMVPSARQALVAEAGDLNGDGLTDLALLHDGSNGSFIGFHLQTANGFGAEQLLALPQPAQYEVNALALGDINNDGCVDAVVADFNQGLLLISGSACRTEADMAVQLVRQGDLITADLLHQVGDDVGQAELMLSLSSRGAVSVMTPDGCSANRVTPNHYSARCFVGAMQANESLSFLFQVSAASALNIDAYASSELDDPQPENNHVNVGPARRRAAVLTGGNDGG